MIPAVSPCSSMSLPRGVCAALFRNGARRIRKPKRCCSTANREPWKASARFTKTRADSALSTSRRCPRVNVSIRCGEKRRDAIMHQSSFDKMAEFSREYLGPLRKQPLTILDLGSCDYNGTYRSLFYPPPRRYIGVDLDA